MKGREEPSGQLESVEEILMCEEIFKKLPVYAHVERLYKEEKLYEKHKDSFKNLETMQKFKESDENAYNFLMSGAIGEAVGQELEKRQAQVEALTQELTELMQQLYDVQQEQDTLDLEEKKLPKNAKKEKNAYTDKYLKALEKESKTKEKIAELEREHLKILDQ